MDATTERCGSTNMSPGRWVGGGEMVSATKGRKEKRKREGWSSGGRGEHTSTQKKKKEKRGEPSGGRETHTHMRTNRKKEMKGGERERKK